MIRKLKSRFLLLTTIIAIVLSIGPTSMVSASSLNPHAYIRQMVYKTVYGGYFSTSYPPSNLVSNWSSTNSWRFVTNEMWMSLVDGKEWIEVGDVDGSINGTYWNGHYTAYQKYNSTTKQYDYYEYSVGSKNPTGTHNFEVQYTGNASPWSSYVDYNKAMDFSFSYTSAVAHKVGIEANDDTQSFTNGMYDSALQWKDSSNVWNNWTSSDVTNGDYNTLGWTSAYTSNKVTFSR